MEIFDYGNILDNIYNSIKYIGNIFDYIIIR